MRTGLTRRGFLGLLAVGGVGLTFGGMSSTHIPPGMGVDWGAGESVTVWCVQWDEARVVGIVPKGRT